MNNPNDENNTCFGCENLTTTWYADESITYSCTLHPGIIRGENNTSGCVDPERCERFRKDLNYET
jgi:hypothetical protein